MKIEDGWELHWLKKERRKKMRKNALLILLVVFVGMLTLFGCKTTEQKQRKEKEIQETKAYYEKMEMERNQKYEAMMAILREKREILMSSRPLRKLTYQDYTAGVEKTKFSHVIFAGKRETTWSKTEEVMVVFAWERAKDEFIVSRVPLYGKIQVVFRLNEEIPSIKFSFRDGYPGSGDWSSWVRLFDMPNERFERDIESIIFTIHPSDFPKELRPLILSK